MPLTVHGPSEGDRLSGLVVDALGDALVIASSAAWVEAYRATIEQALTELTGALCAVRCAQASWHLISPLQHQCVRGSSAAGALVCVWGMLGPFW